MKAFLVSKYPCSSAFICGCCFFAFNDLRSLAGAVLRQAGKYSLCGQGVIMGLPTVFGKDPNKLTPT